MALIKIANLILLLLAGSTDAFATPRARVARGGASSAKARDAVLLNWLLAKARDSDDLPPTKPKPLAVELAVDVGIVAATLGLFRRAGCIRARDCGPRTVLAARLFFAVANSILIALYASALRYARRLPASPVVTHRAPSFRREQLRRTATPESDATPVVAAPKE